MGRRVVNTNDIRQSGKNYKLGEKLSYVRDFLGGASDVLISIYMFVILVVLPFYYQEGYTHIGTDKSVFFRYWGELMGKITLPVVALYLILMAVVYWLQNGKENWKKLFKHFSVTDIFAAFFGISVLLSYSQTQYRQSAWLGSSGWYMGCFTQMILVVSYFLVSRAWKRHLWLVLSVIPVTLIVFALGIVNRFGIYPIDMKLENPMFISTIGNINWFCGYLVCIFFGVMYYYWQMDWSKTGQNKWFKILGFLYLMVGFAALVVQGSSSGILAMAAVFVTLFVLSAENSRRMQALGECALCFAGICLILCVVLSLKWGAVEEDDAVFLILTNGKVAVSLCAVALFFWGMMLHSSQKGSYSVSLWSRISKGLLVGIGVAAVGYFVVLMGNTLSGGRISDALGLPEQNFLYFSPLWGSRRGATWQAGAMCFSGMDWWHKIVGAGPDCLEFVVKEEKNTHVQAMVAEMFGQGIRLTNAHNEWFTILINEGIFGFISFVGMMTTAIYRFLKARKSSLITGICGICLLAYTVNNMVSFQQSLNASTIFIVLAVGENYLKHNRKQGKEEQ